MKTIWIVGSSGHMGSALLELIDCKRYEIITTDRDEVDIANEEQVDTYMRINRPDVIINCAGLSDRETCEKNVDEAYRINAVGVRNLAQSAEGIQAKLIQISTDDVFSDMSDRPYNEFDKVSPDSIYGKSKLAGEDMLSKFMTRYVIIRSSWLYGTGHDFLDEVVANVGKVKSMKVSRNVYAVPTSTAELAKVVTQFIDGDHFGLYHAVCTGEACSRFDYAKEVLRAIGKEDELELIPIDDEAVSKPAYSALDNMMLRITGLEEPGDWKETLKEYLKRTGGIR